MTTGGAGPLVPTFHGFVHNSMDGLILFEACLSGKLHHVPRRPHDRERSSLIKSGSIFIYEENASGIKRWTDGVAWSPSRILGNFLIYRELEKPFPPGEKKRAMKRKRASLPGEPYPRRGSEQQEPEVVRPLTPPTPTVTEPKSADSNGEQEKELERSLIGSLVDSYGFRPDGLVKKTMSISVNGISHHMVSYYKVEDVKNQLLPRPFNDARLSSISVRPELYLKQNFRAPLEESEHYAIDGQMHAHPQMLYSSMNGNAYGVRSNQYYGGQYPQMYALPNSTTNIYASTTSTAWPATPTSAGGMPYSAQSTYAAQQFPSSYYKTESQNATSIKDEQQHPVTPSINGYGQQYTASYPTIQREQSQSSNGLIHSSYSTPVQQQAPAFTSMSAPTARSMYTNGIMNGAVTNGQVYTNGHTQQYPVRSPSQQYAIGGAQATSTTQSPHHSVKSPALTAPSNNAVQPVSAMTNDQLHNGQIAYRRSTAYGLPHTPQSAGHSASDLSGLGITGNGSYATGYGTTGPAFRAVAEVGGAQGGQHYGQ